MFIRYQKIDPKKQLQIQAKRIESLRQRIKDYLIEQSELQSLRKKSDAIAEQFNAPQIGLAAHVLNELDELQYSLPTVVATFKHKKKSYNALVKKGYEDKNEINLEKELDSISRNPVVGTLQYIAKKAKFKKQKPRKSELMHSKDLQKDISEIVAIVDEHSKTFANISNAEHAEKARKAEEAKKKESKLAPTFKKMNSHQKAIEGQLHGLNLVLNEINKLDLIERAQYLKLCLGVMGKINIFEDQKAEEVRKNEILYQIQKLEFALDKVQSTRQDLATQVEAKEKNKLMAKLFKPKNIKQAKKYLKSISSESNDFIVKNFFGFGEGFAFKANKALWNEFTKTVREETEKLAVPKKASVRETHKSKHQRREQQKLKKAAQVEPVKPHHVKALLSKVSLFKHSQYQYVMLKDNEEENVLQCR